MTRRAIFSLLGIAAVVSLAAGVLFARATQPTGRWAADREIKGATAQLWFTIRTHRSFESQIACKGSKVVRQSSNDPLDATRACRLLAENRRFFTTLLTSQPPRCPTTATPRRGWVRYQGEVWGEKVNRYFYPGPCRSQMDNFYSAFALSKLLAPAEVKQKSTAPSESQREEIRRARRAGKDPRPSSDRLYPCPPGVKSTPVAPCRKP